MTSHPKDASHKLIDTIAAQPKLCKHLHLPVQCGSDRLLKEMNRHYTVEQYMELIEYARKKVPGITFSSDIIVGFPGETEEDFVRDAGTGAEGGLYAAVHLYLFQAHRHQGGRNARPHPPQGEDRPHDPPAQGAGRDRHGAGQGRRWARPSGAGGGYGRSEGTLSGRLDNNLTVEFTADAALMGSYANVHLTGARATVLLGELA